MVDKIEPLAHERNVLTVALQKEKTQENNQKVLDVMGTHFGMLDPSGMTDEELEHWNKIAENMNELVDIYE